MITNVTRSRFNFLAVLLLACANSGAGESAASSLKHHVPDGFIIERVAGEREVVFPMFGALDERGRLFVAESSGLDLYAELRAQTRKCQVRLLEDQDGDGRYESARVFAEGLVFPMGLAWRDRKLYVADPPDLVTLEDTDGDGRSDKRTVILTGFGHRDNGSLHGLTFGPDGRLYMTTGHPDGYKLRDGAGNLITGESGALIRCRPDGSDVEIVCRGFENLVEVAFTSGGEIIGTDNWFQRPSGGFRDALVHLVEGGLYPLNNDVGTPQPITGQMLPPIALFPAVALSGLALYRGEMFPEPMRGNLFSAQHNARKVGRHVLLRDRSTFRTEDFDFVTSDDPDFHPSDVVEHADGSLLVIDTGGWYVQHCPTGRIRDSRASGAIYRVRRVGVKPVDDPWGLQIDWTGLSAEAAAKLLSDPRPMVRDRAQQLLSARGEQAIDVLAGLLSQAANGPAGLHALWALTAISRNRSLPPLRKTLQAANPDLVVAAARALALRRDHLAAPELERLLTDSTPRVRLAGAEALAHCGDTNSLLPLWQALAGEPDRFFEHALVHALHWLADTGALEIALKHPSPRVQKAALLLLDQPPRPRTALKPESVIQRVTASDAELRQIAMRVLKNHPEWAEHTIALIRDWLAKTSFAPEEQAGLRDLLLAFQSDSVIQELIGATVARSSAPAPIRIFLLETLARISLPKLPASWVDALAAVIHQADSTVRLEAARTVAVLQVPSLDDQLAGIAENLDEPLELRLEALRAIVLRKPRLSAAGTDLLISQLANRTSPIARLAAVEILRRSELTDIQLLRALRTIRGDPLLSLSSLLAAFHEPTGVDNASALLDFLTEAVRNGWKPPGQDWSKALDRFPSALRDRADKLREWSGRNAEHDRAKLAEFEPLLTGGDQERGRAIFFGNQVACSTCHAIGDAGGKAGPDLTKIGAIRSGRDILESILLPSSTFAQGYESYFVLTTDGGEMSGIIARQSTDALVLRDAGGGELQLQKNKIKAMDRQAISLMPEGLERGLGREEFRSLLAFLQSLK